MEFIDKDRPWITEEEMWIRIENAATWKIKRYEKINPANERARVKYWGGIKKKFIEGFWGKDFGRYRFMPPSLYFYINMCLILHVDDENNRRPIKPILRDVDWAMSYMFLMAKGFSGFEDDDEYTCWRDIDTVPIEDIINNKKYRKKKKHVLRKDGRKKKYMNARDYLYKLHDKPLGIPLYHNHAKNVCILGSRRRR